MRKGGMGEGEEENVVQGCRDERRQEVGRNGQRRIRQCGARVKRYRSAWRREEEPRE